MKQGAAEVRKYNKPKEYPLQEIPLAAEEQRQEERPAPVAQDKETQPATAAVSQATGGPKGADVVMKDRTK